MIELYERLTRGCQTKNQVNAVHIALENRMTPLEVASLWSNLTREASWPERARRRWLRRASKLPVLSETVRRSGSWTELQLRPIRRPGYRGFNRCSALPVERNRPPSCGGGCAMQYPGSTATAAGVTRRC
jgi:hypothetical protein